MKLNDGFEVVRGSILMLNPLPSISHAYRLLMQEEKHKQLYQPNTNIHEPVAFTASNIRYYDQEKYRQVAYQNNNTRDPAQRRINYYCDHCKIPGHSIQRCYKLNGNQGYGGNPGYGGKKMASNVEFDDHKNYDSSQDEVILSGDQYQKFSHY